LRERIAKKAVVLPTLIRVKSTTIVVTRPTAFRGIRRVGCTWMEHVSIFRIGEWEGP